MRIDHGYVLNGTVAPWIFSFFKMIKCIEMVQYKIQLKLDYKTGEQLFEDITYWNHKKERQNLWQFGIESFRQFQNHLYPKQLPWNRRNVIPSGTCRT